jgi:lipoate-protein ligase A
VAAPIRLLHLGAVSPLRSQAIYHGLAEAMTEDSPDTIALLNPAAPYFCVGFHQNPAEELDLAWCRRQGYPVLHRKIGGGTVYLDRNHLFYQCIFHRSRAPFDVTSIYRRFLTPPVEALRRLGLDAHLSGVNEIEVGGRRIAGTGGGQIGEAMVVAGNILFDFDYDTMVRAWRVPSRAFRRLAADGLCHHVTTMRRELGRVPSFERVQRFLVEEYAETLGRPVAPGSLIPDEEEAVTKAEAEMTGPAPAVKVSDRRDRGLKIARGVFASEREVSIPAGLIRLTLRVRDGMIDDLSVDGAAPSGLPLTDALKGIMVWDGTLEDRLRAIPGGDGQQAAARLLAGAILAVKDGGRSP